MPLYTFHCRNCDSDFEVFMSLRELSKGAVCPSCKGKDTDGPVDSGRCASRQMAPAACGPVQKELSEVITRRSAAILAPENQRRKTLTPGQGPNSLRKRSDAEPE